jgi:hypothetical protein
LLQVLVARRLLLGEHQRGLRLIHLRLVGGNLGLLHIELRVDVLDAGMRGRDLCLGLCECDAIVAVIDAGDHLARGDMFVVGDGDGGDVAGHFWGKRGLPRRDEGVVGGLKMFCVVHVDVGAGDRGGEKHGAYSGDNGAAMQEAAPSPFDDGRWLSCFRPNGRGRLFGSRAFVRGRSPRGDVLFVGLDAGLV